MAHRFWLAVVLATTLLIGGGIVYRVVASRYARSVDSEPLPPGTLAQLPFEIQDWRGRDVPLEEAVIRATDTDQHLNRIYTRDTHREAVSVFVAYGVRLRDLMPHRPEVCYPGTGWTFQDSRDVDLRLDDGSTLPCRILHFNRGGLMNQHVTVLNYYVVDGVFSPDVELLRSRIWKPSGGADYVAQVQITCASDAFGPLTDEAVRAFGSASAIPIRCLFPSKGPESDRQS
ncbi:MAG: EpsI family protein [Phycisphaerae bacterium]|nr:EpsI family protein [Phycisphaerae bacterium]